MPEQAIVKPLPHAARTYKQSRFDALPRVPMRMLITGRSAAGKGTFISSLVLDHDRDVFECISIFSSTVHLDPTWLATPEHAREELGQGKTDDPASIEFVYDEFDETAIRRIIDKQQDSLKRQNRRKSSKSKEAS